MGIMETDSIFVAYRVGFGGCGASGQAAAGAKEAFE
jgi:hypothetical protein